MIPALTNIRQYRDGDYEHLFGINGYYHDQSLSLFYQFSETKKLKTPLRQVPLPTLEQKL
jgi:hypothetical protein